MILSGALLAMEFVRGIFFRKISSLIAMAFLLAFITILSRFILKIKDKQELAILIFMILFYATRLAIKYPEKPGPFDNSLDTFYLTCNFALSERIVAARIPTSRHRTVFTICTMIVRFLIVPFNDISALILQLICTFSMVYLDLDKEKQDKNLFESYFKSKNQLEKFKNLVVNDIPEGIVIISQDLTQSLFANKAFSVLSDFDLNPDIRVHLNQFKIYEQEDKSHNAESITALPSNKTLLTFMESTILDADFLSNKRFSCNVSNSRNNSILEVKVFHIVWDEIPSIAVILNDITQQHTIISLKTANAQKDTLLATVSHELRTPLNGMLGMIQVLQKRTQDPESMKYLNICKNSGNLLMGLVNSILDFNQIRAKKFKLNLEKVNLHELLRDIVQLFELQCNQKKIYLKLNISPSAQKHIVTDPNRLSQIFINLVGNALKFTMQGGITISAKESSDGRYVQLAVEDTGIGIKDEDKGKLFKMFGKLEHGNSQTNKQGVGLGLTISDNLARILCGEDSRGGIMLNSCYGKGSKFSFWIKSQLLDEIQQDDDYVSTTCWDEDIDINERMREYTFFSKAPKFQKHALFTSTDHSIVDKRLSRLINNPQFKSEGYMRFPKPHLKSDMHVLIVDDNPFNITVAEYLIKLHGYSTKTALYGQTAIDMMLNNNHDAEPIKVILMDFQMPIMDGYETTKVLRKLMKEGKIPEIPIVALTANNSEADKEASRKAGMWDHMTKPLKEADLFKIFNKYIE